MNHQVIIDNDGAPDDLAAVRILLRREKLDLAGVVATYGCASQSQVARNLSSFLGLGGESVASLRELIHQGADAPGQLIPGRSDVPRFFGDNGICDVTLPDTAISPNELKALNDLADKIISCGLCEYIVTGPCTTFAQVIHERPEVMKYIQAVHIMGTAIDTPGNEGPLDENGNYRAEYNIYLDPVAFQRVLTAAADNGIPVKIVSWDQCKEIKIPKSVYVNATPMSDDLQAEMVRKMVLGFFDLYGDDKLSDEEKGDVREPVYTMCDAIVPMAMTDRHGHFESLSLTVGTAADNYGVTRRAESGGLPVQIFRPSDVDHLIGETLFDIGLRVRA